MRTSKFVPGIGSILAQDRGQVCQSVQDGGKSLKWSGSRDQYPRDIIKPEGLKEDVQSNAIRHKSTREIIIVIIDCYLRHDKAGSCPLSEGRTFIFILESSLCCRISWRISFSTFLKIDIPFTMGQTKWHRRPETMSHLVAPIQGSLDLMIYCSCAGHVWFLSFLLL